MYDAIIGYDNYGHAIVGHNGLAVGANDGGGADPALVAALAQALIVAKQSHIVEDRGPGRSYEELLGFPATKICKGDCVTIFTKPVPVLTKVQNLVIQSGPAPFLLIHSLKMGKFEMLVTGDPVPAEMFIPQASNWLKLNGLTLNPGVTASITVENTSGGELTFAGGFFTAVVE